MVATFDLAQNPFYLLRAEFSDPPTRIRERAEDAVADGRIDEASTARAEQTLAAPATRLGAEVSGLVGAEQRSTKAIYDALNAERLDILRSLTRDLPPLARANVAAYLVDRFRDVDDTLLQFSILDRAWAAIRPETIAKELESDRQKAGVKPADSAKVAEALEHLRHRHARVMRVALEETGSASEALTRLVESSTEAGECGLFLEAVVRDYDAASEPRLTELRERLDHVVGAIRNRPEGAAQRVTEIEPLLAEWDKINQPAQLLDQKLGHEEPRSRELASGLRDLALWLANEHELHDEAATITRAVARTFPELEGVYETARQDLDALTKIIADKPTSESLNTLSALCDRLPDDPVFRDQLRLRGLSAGPKVLPLRRAFAAALDATRGHETAEVPWRMMRALAIDLHNEHQETAGAARLIESLIRWTPPPPSGVSSVLRNDHRNLERQRLWGELASAKDNPEHALNITEKLIVISEGSDKQKLASIRTTLRRRITSEHRSKIGSRLKWAVVIIIGIAVIYSATRDNGAKVRTPPTRYAGTSASTSTEPRTGPNDWNSATSISPDRPAIETVRQEQRPPIATGRVLTEAEIRYCEFQSARLDAAKRIVRSDTQIFKFNLAVKDWNSRCSNYRYQPSDMRQVETEVRRNSVRLAAEGRALVTATIAAPEIHEAGSATAPPGNAPAPSATSGEELRRPQGSLADTGPAVSAGANLPTTDGGAQERKPPIGTGTIFSEAEVRYCKFQSARLEAAERIIRSSAQVANHNRAVRDWNSRCSNYRYRPGDMRRVEAEVYQNRVRLAAEGRALVATASEDLRTPSATTTAPPGEAPWRVEGSMAGSGPAAAAGAEETAETPLDLRNREYAAEVQRRLAAGGYYAGPIDGLFGRGSVAALRRFKRSDPFLPDDDVWDIETQRRLFGGR